MLDTNFNDSNKKQELIKYITAQVAADVRIKDYHFEEIIGHNFEDDESIDSYISEHWSDNSGRMLMAAAYALCQTNYSSFSYISVNYDDFNIKTRRIVMREYLFRGKMINGKWSEGNLLVTKQGCCITPDATVLGSYGAVDPETVGQYTGLTDKNGTKIFEGDIVKYGDTVHNVVFEQRNGTAYFGLVYSTLETLSFGYYQDLKQIEVIGNIYDNPELLGNEENA